jgi:hypothetical protein
MTQKKIKINSICVICKACYYLHSV